MTLLFTTGVCCSYESSSSLWGKHQGLWSIRSGCLPPLPEHLPGLDFLSSFLQGQQCCRSKSGQIQRKKMKVMHMQKQECCSGSGCDRAESSQCGCFCAGSIQVPSCCRMGAAPRPGHCHLVSPTLSPGCSSGKKSCSIFPVQTPPAVLLVLASAKGYKIHLFAKKAT